MQNKRKMMHHSRFSRRSVVDTFFSSYSSASMLESESLSPRGDRSEGLETDSVLEDDDVRLLKFEVLLVNLLRLIPPKKISTTTRAKSK